jgi:hypothetical protein
MEKMTFSVLAKEHAARTRRSRKKYGTHSIAVGKEPQKTLTMMRCGNRSRSAVSISRLLTARQWSSWKASGYGRTKGDDYEKVLSMPSSTPLEQGHFHDDGILLSLELEQQERERKETLCIWDHVNITSFDQEMPKSCQL